MKKQMSALALAAVGLMSLCAVANAQSTIYTSQASFLVNVQPGYYLEDFESLIPGDLFTGPVAFTGNGHGFSVDTSSGDVYVTSGLPQGLGTFTASDSLTITFDTPITAFGGNFFLTDSADNLAAGNVTLNLSDGTTTTFNFDGVGDPLPFRGFISNTPITSMTMPNPGQLSRFNTFDNFIVGIAAPVPAPSSVVSLLMGGGLMSIRLVSKRRRK